MKFNTIDMIINPVGMSRETSGILLEKIFQACGHHLRITFDGNLQAEDGLKTGKPADAALAGADFYRSFAEGAKTLSKGLVSLEWTLKTSGSGMDEDLAAFMASRGFICELMMKGPESGFCAGSGCSGAPQESCFEAGSGCSPSALDAVSLLKKYAVPIVAGCLVSEDTVQALKPLWQALMDMELYYHRYIPETDGSLSADSYGDFLCRLYDLWEETYFSGINVSVRWFDDVARVIMGMQSEVCTMSGKCYNRMVCSPEGRVYPCEYYMQEEFCLGDIRELSIGDMLSSDRALEFTAFSQLPMDCRLCDSIVFCNGGCRKEKAPRSGKTAFCEAYKRFFEYAVPRMEAVLSGCMQG